MLARIIEWSLRHVFLVLLGTGFLVAAGVYAIVHTPIEDAERVAEIVQEAARDAGRLLFGARPAVFPLSCVIVQDYASAK